MRPTYGLVSRHGAMALSWTLDKVGPFAHTAEDCGIDPAGDRGQGFEGPRERGKKFLLHAAIRAADEGSEDRLRAHRFHRPRRARRAPAFAAALAACKETGVQLVETKLPEFPYGPILSTILGAEEASIFEPLISSGKVNDLADPAQIAGLKASLDVPAKDYLKAMRLRRLMQDAFQKLFSEVDALLTTGRAGAATPINQDLDAVTSVPGGFSGIIPAGNLAGCPLWRSLAAL